MRYLAFGFHCSVFQSKLTCNGLSQARLQSPVEFLISLYREHGNKKPFCDSIFDLKEQLVALQLVMAKLNKEVRVSTQQFVKVSQANQAGDKVH